MVCMRPVYSKLVAPKLAVSKLVVFLLALTSLAWAAAPQFSGQKRVGLTSGDQWEPAVAADGSGRIYVLYPTSGQGAVSKTAGGPTLFWARAATMARHGKLRT